MAEGKASFVARLVKDPANPPALIVLSGYEGDSDKDKHTRVYLDLQLSSYVDVPHDAVAHRESVTRDQSPAGGVYIWVAASAADRLSPGGSRVPPEGGGPFGGPPPFTPAGCGPF